VIMSDGVHDNLDPQTLGKLPADMPNSSWQTWSEVPHDALMTVKSEYMRTLLGEIIFANDDTSPVSITARLIHHCQEVTRKAREFMENNPNKKQPTDYIEFPGKMDHTTCVTFVVGPKGSSSPAPVASSSSSSSPHHESANGNDVASSSAAS